MQEEHTPLPCQTQLKESLNALRESPLPTLAREIREVIGSLPL
jgi:hypothetical protein